MNCSVDFDTEDLHSPSDLVDAQHEWIYSALQQIGSFY